MQKTLGFIFTNPVTRQLAVSLLIFAVVSVVPLTNSQDKSKELIIKMFVSLSGGLIVNNILVLNETKNLINKIAEGDVNINDKIVTKVINDVGNFVDEDILFVFKDFFNPFTSNLKNIRKRELVIETNVKRQFEILYMSVLDNLSDGRLYATSSVSRDYFWKEENNEDESVEKSSEIFIKKNKLSNKIERIFIVKEADLKDRDRIVNVIHYQAKCGIEVFCVNESDLPKNFIKFFLVVESIDNKGLKFTWETRIAPSNYSICGMNVYATLDKYTENHKLYFNIKNKATPWKNYFESLGLPVSESNNN